MSLSGSARLSSSARVKAPSPIWGMAIPGANDTAMFETFVEEVLVPELRPGDVVVWDNLQLHRAEEVVEIVEYETTARVAPHAERSAPRSDDTEAD